MKPISIFVLWIFLFSASTLNAQEFSFGIGAGMGIAHIRTPDWPELHPSYKPIPSMGINGYIGLKVSGKSGLSTEPGLIIKGGILKNDLPTGDQHVKHSLTYMQLPISLDYYLNEKFYISAGPELAILLRATQRSGGSLHDVSEFFDQKTELGGQVTFNFAITEQLDLGLRYSRSFSYTLHVILTDINGSPIGEGNTYNQYLHLHLKLKLRNSYTARDK